MPISRFEKINGTVLKVIACISMLIDHIAAGIIYPIVVYGVYRGRLSFDQMSTIYYDMRCIGRTAFPIFCFLLVEGLTYTSNRVRYAVSLLIFAFISEIPYDIYFFAENDVFNPNISEVLIANKDLLFKQCNVYFTLFFGLLVIWAIDRAFKYLREKNLHPILYPLCCALFTTIGCIITNRLNTDYDYKGIILIVIFYVLKKYKYLSLVAAYLFITGYNIEYMALPGFILLALYNGKRGARLGNLKYLFYFFYPLHIIVMYYYRCFMY